MAIKPFNSVGGFSVGESPANVILGNGDITTGNANLTANLYVTNTANVGNLRTDNILYANGTPWDFQEAAGNTWQIQYNVSNNFAASANFTYDDSIQNFVILGNANVTKTFFGNIGSFTGNISALNANLGNLATANYVNVANQINGNIANFSGNLTSLNANLGNLATANYVNVANQINGNIANFSGNLTSLNASLGNLATANFVNVSSNVTTSNLTVNLELSGNTANFSGNIVTLNANLGNLATANFVNVSSNLSVTDTANVGNLRTDNLLYANGQPWDLQEAAGSNTQVQYNDGNNDFAASANFTYDDVASNLTVLGNIIATSFIGNISGNIQAPGANTEILFNDANITNAVANFSYDKAYNSGGGELNVGNTVGGQIITDNVYASYGNIGNLDVVTDITVGGNISTTGAGGDITMSGGNITGVNNISANSANYTANVIANNLTVNLELSGNTANFTGNIIAANIIGALANGTSNVKVYNNANIEISINGSANTATFASTGLYVVGEINTTAGNILSNGNITANGFLNSANANVTGQATLGSVLTANITAPTGAITISAAGANNNIILSPTGVGNVDVGLHNITQVALPVNPNDAATKEYVDNISQGLYIHPAANVTSVSNLTASYLNGGTILSVTTIAGGKTITFSANHGLSVDSDIEFTNSFNGIIAGEQYFVFSVPAANQITIKDGYFGGEITTLTNATGLTQPALGEGGVGATLTNAGAQAALTIDGILTTVGARVLVQGQTNQAENGIYSVTTVGTGATNWVLTRATDGNSYAPKSDTQLGAGSYFFIMQGSQYAGSSYVLTAPPGEINFGTSNIVFSQFSQAGSYTAGNGIAITGTLISANVDLNTTTIVGGNIVVKTSANLTTPNIGDATFSSITWNTLSNGNVTANNLSIGNIANITGNLRVDGVIQSNGNISSNANINGNNAYFTNLLNVGGNLLANNITSNNAFSTNTANISSNLVTSNATVNLELAGNTANFSGNVVVPNLTVNTSLSGNTANFSGNVVVPNLTVNLQLSGNTANFTGNVVALNTNAGNLLTANFANIASNITTSNLAVNLALTGNTANFSGNITSLNANLGNLATANYFTGTFINGTSNVAIPNSNGNINLTAGGNTSLVVTATGANITGNLGVSGNFSVGSLIADNLTANLSVFVGTTRVGWGTTTTSNIDANQTIAQFSTTGIAAIEFLVKGEDVTGAKYSVATVTAVTDGTSVDYATYATAFLTSGTGALAVNITGGNVALQVTPASSNSTVWTTQYRVM